MNYLFFHKMTQFFVKQVDKDSQEHVILKYLLSLPKEDQKKFLKIYRMVPDPLHNHVHVSMAFCPTTLFDLQQPTNSISWSRSECVKQLVEILSFLKAKRIIHQDVHMKNILYNHRKKQFFLIDFGISKKLQFINATSWYDYYYYHLQGDLFQFFWNFYFQHNQYLDNFSEFRLKISAYDKKKKQKLLNQLKSSMFYAKNIADSMIRNQIHLFFKPEDKIEFHHKKEKILFKFIVQRLYFLDTFPESFKECKSRKKKVF